MDIRKKLQYIKYMRMSADEIFICGILNKAKVSYDKDRNMSFYTIGQRVYFCTEGNILFCSGKRVWNKLSREKANDELKLRMIKIFKNYSTQKIKIVYPIDIGYKMSIFGNIKFTTTNSTGAN